jgi:hypothetical protein
LPSASVRTTEYRVSNAPVRHAMEEEHENLKRSASHAGLYSEQC